MPAERQRRAQVVALGGVVVDHVEDHLDPGLVQRPDHRLELQHLLAAGAEAGVVVVRGEEPDRVVAPVVAQTLLVQRRVVHELVHRHQLDRGHPQLPEVPDHRRVRQPGVAAPDVLGDVGVAHRHALDVRLVDHGLVVGDAQRPVAGPVEERVDHHRGHRVRGGVGVVVGARVAEAVAEQRLVPVDVSRRRPWRRGPAAACSGCSAARRRGRAGRAPGSRSAARARPGAGSRARSARCARAA